VFALCALDGVLEVFGLLCGDCPPQLVAEDHVPKHEIRLIA
jgi:hypothetical protein